MSHEAKRAGAAVHPGAVDTGPRSLAEAREAVRSRLRSTADDFSNRGLPRPALDGKLLRPLVAYLSVPPEQRARLDGRFWAGALAVEMVHEASLLHDDILDEATRRRGRPTMMAEEGVGPALVKGDHLLTAAYRAAAETQSPAFLQVFIRSVERTVAGELAQETCQGRVLSREEYARNITGKSGELFRSALTLAPTLLEIGHPGRAGDLGARLGCLYQMVDDFLDYCPNAERGKEPLKDYRQRKWTWPLGLIDTTDFDDPAPNVVARLFLNGETGQISPMERGSEMLEADVRDWIESASGEGLETAELGGLLLEWSRLIRRAATREVELARISVAEHRTPELRPAESRTHVRPEASTAMAEDASLDLARRQLRMEAAELQTSSGRLDYFGRHAKSFRFASRLFPKDQLERVAGVYAFCRFTDDLVDEAEADDPQLLSSRMDAWLAMARDAYEGRTTGTGVLDEVMGEMRRGQVPFHYAEELVKGVRMDLVPRRYRSLEDLRRYSYRVASVVGGWLTELFGIRDPWVLERAYALGHAMQLTNILRDVGEDLREGRLYVPEDLMSRYGVERECLEAGKANGTPPPPAYSSLLEHLMERADEDYDRAFEAIPSLPRFFQGPVAVAASVYQGIHREIRKNGYDNLNRRARTTLSRKFVLAARGLWRLRRVAAAAARSRENPGALAEGSPKEGQEAAA